MRYNLTETEGQREYTPIPAGLYRMVISDATEGEAGPNAKNAGAAKLNLELTVNDDGEYQDRKVFENITLVERSMWKLKSVLTAAGFDTDNEEVDFEPDDLVGLEMDVKVRVQKGRKNPETGEEYSDRNQAVAFYQTAS